jgi:hypothetical protein
MFLYNSKPNFIPNREAIIKLIQNIDKIEGVDYIQIAHASLAPVVYEINKIVMVGSLLSYPYYRCRHGKKIFKVILKFSGLDEIFVNRKIGTECQPQYCISGSNKEVEGK